jgi:hypothetical protein
LPSIQAWRKFFFKNFERTVFDGPYVRVKSMNPTPPEFRLVASLQTLPDIFHAHRGFKKAGTPLDASAARCAPAV